MGASNASVKSDFAAIGRVPVVSASGERLMPCKPSKARALPKAKRLCEVARGWGNKSAASWASDKGFIRYLTVMDGAFQAYA